ncbi:MAG TPA: hypothetical protein VNF49_03715, partial [Candidatus Binataceae bacterium]|nr:hypothetical protein [Candidatus Binataceae bacterium]
MCGALALAMTTGGCWTAALELAPAAIQAVGALGSGIAHVAEASAIESHQSKDQNEMQKNEVCDELATEVPMLVELKTDGSGSTRYRELSLGGAEVDPQWEAMPNQGTDSGGWQPAHNFTTMDFQPPLQNSLSAGSTTYVAYAPAEVQDANEQGELNALTLGFGPDFGTFRWK